MTRPVCPSLDHLVQRPDALLSAFSACPAKWADANRALQLLLRLGWVQSEVAITYSMHSMRHVAPTLGRQLGIDLEVLNVMGGWAGRFPMPLRYDAAECTAELVPKLSIIDNVASGWRPVPRGQLLARPVVRVGDGLPSLVLVSLSPSTVSASSSSPHRR